MNMIRNILIAALLIGVCAVSVGCGGATNVVAESCNFYPTADGAVSVSVVVQNNGGDADATVTPQAVLEGGQRADGDSVTEHMDGGDSTTMTSAVNVPPNTTVVGCDATE